MTYERRKQMTEIAYYFQSLKQVVSLDDDLEALIDLHIMSFERHGWKCVRLDERDAQDHPDFERLTTLIRYLEGQ